MQRRTNIAPFLVVLGMCVGAFMAPWLFPSAEAQRQGYVEKRVVSTGTATGLSAFADQLAPNPENGMCLQYDVSNRVVWGPCGSLPSGGTPGQVAGITVFSTGTATATGWTAASATIFAGSNVVLSTGTSTTTGTSANLSDGPRVHAVGFEPTLPPGGPGEVLCYVGTGTNTTTSKGACAQSTGAAYSFSTSTPAAVATSGSVGTSTTLSRSDHKHQGDGNDKVAAYSGQTADYLENVTRSSDSSIVLAEMSGDLDIRANFGTAVNTVCMGNDSRLSNARTPTAHASTHVEGGSDAIAVATQSVDGLMSHEDKTKLDSTSSTPTANYIPVANASGKLTAWIDAASGSVAGTMSTTHYNLVNGATATPTASRIAISDGSGTLNGWVNGQLVSSTKYTTNAQLSATGAAWAVGYTNTFTATGTKYRVRARAIVDTADANPTYRLCGLAIVADTGSSASTVRDAGWTGAIYYNNFYNSLVANRYVIGTIDADATFTLSTGTVTVGLAMYRMSGSGYCESSSGAAAMYVDIYD